MTARVTWTDTVRGVPFLATSEVVAVSGQSVQVRGSDGLVWLPPGYYARVAPPAFSRFAVGPGAPGAEPVPLPAGLRAKGSTIQQPGAHHG